MVITEENIRAKVLIDLRELISKEMKEVQTEHGASGDITPRLDARLERLTRELSDLIAEQVSQNIWRS